MFLLTILYKNVGLTECKLRISCMKISKTKYLNYAYETSISTN